LDDVERYDLGDLSDLADGQMRGLMAGKIDVLVCRVQGQLYAIEDLCSHADTTLSDGMLRGYTVTCALHGAQFDVRDGAHKGPPAYCGVRTFELDQTPEGVQVVVRKKQKGTSDDGPPSGYYQTR
jgi:3-phenylpropionate/trans-cinnamate dioxygenase ferredoxin subunit